MPPQLQSLIEFWRRLDLARQFPVTSIAVIMAVMLLIGHWLSQRIEDGEIQTTALATALFVESFVGPKLQGMADNPQTHPEVQTELDRLMRETPLGKRVYSFKVWRRRAQIVHASDPDLVGRTFPPAQKLREAWRGEVAAEFDSLNDAEDAGERGSGKALLEIYVPIRKSLTNEIIAVAEFYEEASKLKQDIHQAKLESWLMLGGVGLLAVTSLFGMIAGASRTIAQQRRALEGRVTQLSRLLDQNRKLRQRLQSSSARSAEFNEHFLRRMGSELHDGPAQLVSLALLLLDGNRQPALVVADGAAPLVLPVDVRTTIRGALSDALSEIRNLSHGLSLPELEDLTLAETVRAAVQAHEQRCNCSVAVEIADLPGRVPHITKATCYRFVQEALNNASRHAQAAGVSVSARQEGSALLIEVKDQGPGFDVSTLDGGGRLGLVGLRERLESIGGALTIWSHQGQGTRLLARIPENGGEALKDD